MEKIKNGTAEDREQWFLEQLGSDPIPAEEIEAFLAALHEAKHADEAGALAELLQDTQIGKGDVDGAMRALALRAKWARFDAGFRKVCQDIVAKWFEDDRERKALLEHVAFEKVLPSAECMRRLQVLLALKPDIMVHDKTWGFGFVQRVDSFYKKVEINFAKKSGHQMSYAYAAETLELIDDGHIMALHHHEPEKIEEMVKKDPAEIIRLTLRSFGPRSVALLQEVLVPVVVPEAGWKKFWDGARKVLKTDPHVEIPTKRSEPIRIMDKAFAYDVEWFNRLAKERRIPTLLADLEELAREEDPANLDDHARGVIQDRLAFCVKGAGGQDQGKVVRSLMIAQQLGIEPAALNASHEMDRLFLAKAFLAAAGSLPARDFKAFVGFLAELDPEKLVELLVGLVAKLPVGALNEVIDALLRLGAEEQCAAAIKALTDVKEVPLDLMAWLSKNVDRIDSWSLGTRPAFICDVLSVLELNFDAPRDRAYNTLVGQFDDSVWLKDMLEPMTDVQRRNFLGRMKETSAFPEMDRRSVLGRIIKLFPELEAEMVTRASTAETPGRPQGRMTSLRSHEERRLQLEKLINVDIPQNSKEIGVARSYGDLRENHEFKAAKEMQAILLRREGELKEMLQEVKPTDFQDFPADKAGIGTGVRLRYPDGRSEQYFILGEWDRDESLGIISCTTRLALAVEGRTAGETVTVPTESGEAEAVLEEVLPLSDEIRGWVQVVSTEAVTSEMS